MSTSQGKALREHLLYLLQGGGAHVKFDDVIGDFPEGLRGKRVLGLPYTAWMLLEHMRIAQGDILEFSRNPKHVSPQFPAGYWPAKEAPASNSNWTDSVKRFRADLRAMEALVTNPKADLYKRFLWGDGQTLLREALLLADHNSYHLGQLVMLRRLLGGWKQ
jgi:hypothetical protein